MVEESFHLVSSVLRCSSISERRGGAAVIVKLPSLWHLRGTGTGTKLGQRGQQQAGNKTRPKRQRGKRERKFKTDRQVQNRSIEKQTLILVCRQKKVGRSRFVRQQKQLFHSFQRLVRTSAMWLERKVAPALFSSTNKTVRCRYALLMRTFLFVI